MINAIGFYIGNSGGSEALPQAILLIVGDQSNGGTDPATGKVNYVDMPAYLQTPNYTNVWMWEIDLADTDAFTLYVPQSDRQMGYFDQVAYILSKAYQNVYVVKRSLTGSELATTGIANVSYPRAEMKSRAQAAIAAMDLLYPNGYDKIMQWGQGESDADDETQSLAYQTNLTNWIAEFNAAIGENVRWVLRKTGNLQSYAFPYIPNVAAAQIAVAAADPLVDIISSDDISVYSRVPGSIDNAHFGPSGAIAVGKLFAEKHLQILGRTKQDTTAPVLQSVSVDSTGLIVTLAYNETLNPGVRVYPRQWTIGTKTIKTVTISGTTVQLTLTVPIRVGDTPTISYTKDLFYRENLQDLQSNEVANLVNVTITNTSTVPAATITEIYASNWSAGVNGWTGLSGGVPSAPETVDGVSDCLKIAATDATPIVEDAIVLDFMTAGNKYQIKFDLYLPALFGVNQSNPEIRVGMTGQSVFSNSGIFYREQWQNYEVEFTASANHNTTRIEGISVNFATDVFYIKNYKIYSVV